MLVPFNFKSIVEEQYHKKYKQGYLLPEELVFYINRKEGEPRAHLEYPCTLEDVLENITYVKFAQFIKIDEEGTLRFSLSFPLLYGRIY